MIYMLKVGTSELFECETPEQALSLVPERRLLPAMLRIWTSDEPLRPILFEDLQRMVGHDPVDMAEAERQVNHIISGLVAPLEERGLMFVEDMRGRSISPDGIPSGHPSVDRTYGNPCARVMIRLMLIDHLAGNPVSIGLPQLRTMLSGVETDGWVLIHSYCESVIQHPLTRPYREITMFLSKPRAAFDQPKEG